MRAFEPAGEIPSEVEGTPQGPDDAYCAMPLQGVLTRIDFPDGSSKRDCRESREQHESRN
jgi:hypothetical protein